MKKVISFSILLMLLVIPLSQFTAINTMKKSIERKQEIQLTSEDLFKLLSGQEVEKGNYRIFVKLRDQLYSTLSEDDFWELIRVARGDSPSNSLMTKLKAIGINTLNSQIAKNIIETLAIYKGGDSFVTRYGAVNLKNTYAGMEHWVSTLDKIDKNHNKISDYLEATTEGNIEVIVAAADRRLEEAINTFKEMGGIVREIYSKIYAFRGTISSNLLSELALNPCIGFIEKAPDNDDIIFNLKTSPLQLRFGTNDAKYYNTTEYQSYSSTPWAMGYKGSIDYRVAILDSGIDVSHPELSGYGETLTFTVINETTGVFPKPGWFNITIDLVYGREYYVSVTWSDPAFNYDLYIFRPGDDVNPYTQSVTDNSFEHLYFKADISGTWKIAVQYYSGVGTQPTGRIVVKEVSSTIDTTQLVVGWRDFTDENSTTPYDGYGHGSFVAGIIAAKGVNKAYEGVASATKLIGIRIFNSNGQLTADIYAALDWLISMILTYRIAVVLMPWTLNYESNTLNQYVYEIAQHGAVVVTAAGNNGYGGAYYSPATSDYAIVVGAVNDLNQLANYSNAGNAAYSPDVTAAGGSGIGTSTYTFDTTDENEDGYIGMIGSVDSNDASWPFATPTSNDYTDLNGTSLAAAHVAGLADIVIQALVSAGSNWNFNLNDVLNLKRIILATAVEFPIAEGDYAPTLDRGASDAYEGYGRINADTAVMAIMNRLSLGKIYKYYLGSPNTVTADQSFAPRAWAGYIYLSAGVTYRFFLDVPSTADFDLYIYSPTPQSNGNPNLVASSTNDYGQNEAVSFTPTESGNYLVVVKWIYNPLYSDYQNYGEFSLLITRQVDLGASVEPVSGRNYLVFVYSPNTNPLLIRIYDVPSSADPKIDLVKEADGLPLVKTVNAQGVSKPEIAIYSDTGTIGGIYINISSLSLEPMDNAKLSVLEIIGSLSVESTLSSTLADTSHGVAVNLTGLVSTGEYAFRASPISSIDLKIELIDTLGNLIGSSDSLGTSTENETIEFTASESYYYGIIVSNAGSSDINIYLDDVGLPSLEVNSPSNNTYQNTTTIAIEYSSSDIETDIAKVDFYVNGVYEGTETAKAGTHYITRSEGRYVITIKVYDQANNVYVYNLTITIDLTPPQLDDIYPINNTYINQTSFDLSWYGSDNYGIKHYLISIDGGPYDTTYSTSYPVTLTQGNHTVSIIAYDLANNKYEITIYFAIDITPPDVLILTPSNNTYFNTTIIYLEWERSDTFGKLRNTELIINDTVTIDVALDVQYNVNLSDYFDPVEGVYYIRIKVYDYAGNFNYSTIIIYVDITPPEFVRSTPGDGAYINDTNIVFTWWFTDRFGLLSYEAYRNGTLVYTGNVNSTTITFSSEGVFNITITAYDLAMNKRTVSIYVTIDVTPPELVIITPENNSYVNRDSIYLSWNASDNIRLDYLELYRNGSSEPIIFYPPESEYTFQTSDGVYLITLIAFDKAGNKNVQQIIVYVDTTAPNLDIISPAPDTYLRAVNITIEWSAFDNFELDHYVIEIGDIKIEIYDTTNTSLSISLEGEGQYTIRVTAYDKAGNARTRTVTVFVDFTPPTLHVVNPLNNSYIGSRTLEIIWASEDDFGISHTEISIDGSPFVTVEEGNNFIVSSLTEGEHYIRIRLYDRAGWVTEVYVSFIVDLTAPQISILEPTEDKILNSSEIIVKYQASDNYELDHFKIYIDNEFVGTTSYLNYTIVTSSGNHIIRVVAFDKAGNSAYNEVSITVDNTPPNLVIRRPLDGARINTAQVTVEWIATDNMGIDHYEVKVDDKPWMNIGSRTWYTFTLETGPHNIYVKAVDIAGNTAIKKISITITEETVVSISGPLAAAIGLGITLASIFGAAYISAKRRAKALKKRKKKRTTTGVNRYMRAKI